MLKELTVDASGACFLSRAKLLLVLSGAPAGASNTRGAIVLMIVVSVSVVVPRNQIWVDTKTFPTLS